MTAGVLRASAHPADWGRNGRRQRTARAAAGAAPAGHRHGRQAELARDVGPGEHPVARDVVGAGRPGPHDAGEDRPTDVVLVDELDGEPGDRRRQPHRPSAGVQATPPRRRARGEEAGTSLAPTVCGPSTIDGRRRYSSTSGCRAGLAEEPLQLGLLLRVEQVGGRPDRPVLGQQVRVVGMEAVGGHRRHVHEPAGAGVRRRLQCVQGPVDVDGPGRLGLAVPCSGRRGGPPRRPPGTPPPGWRRSRTSPRR